MSDTEISEYRIHQIMTKVDDDLGNYAVLAEELLRTRQVGSFKDSIRASDEFDALAPQLSCMHVVEFVGDFLAINIQK